MSFSKALIRQLSPLLLAAVCWSGMEPALAQAGSSTSNPSGTTTSNPSAGSTSTASDASSGSPSDVAKKPALSDAQKKALALATKPVNPKILPLVNEGYTSLSKGKYDKAIKVLKKAVAEDKECISARRYLAYALIQKGSAKEALSEMQIVSKIVPPNSFDFYLFAAAYYAAGGTKEAVDCYGEALRQNPAYDAARAGLVKSLTRQHNFEEALNNVQVGLQLTKDNAVKKYYASLGKAVAEAQSYQQQATNGSTQGGATLSTQVGGDAVKSQPVIIK